MGHNGLSPSQQPPAHEEMTPPRSGHRGRTYSLSDAAGLQDQDIVIPSAAYRELSEADSDGNLPRDVPRSTYHTVEHVAEEVSLYSSLAFCLASYVGIGWKWLAQFLRLVLFSVVLLPGFIQMFWFYLFSPRCIRGVRYGFKPRQLMDVYVPRARWFKSNPSRPVAIFVTGGAWIIGHRAWGALLARRLSQRGVLVCSIDYRNFPQGTAEDMIEDFNTAMRWVCRRIHRYGGDPSRVTVLGQSAGAHIAAMGILHQALRRAECPAHAHNGPAPRWSAQKDLERGQRGAAVPTSDGATAPQPYGEVADCPDGAGTGSAPLTLDLHAAGSPAGHSPRGSSPRCNGSPLRAPLLGDDARDGPGTPCYPAGPLSPHGVSALRLGESTSPGKEIRRALFRRSSGPALREGAEGREGQPFGACPEWDVEKLYLFIGISGVYDVVRAVPHFNARGMYESLTRGIFSRDGQLDLFGYSPTLLVSSQGYRAAAGHHPPVLLLHGDRDKTSPLEQSVMMHEALVEAGVQTQLEIMEGHTHTSPLLESPMAGQDHLVDAITDRITDPSEPTRRLHWIYRVPMCPEFMTRFAGWVCPF